MKYIVLSFDDGFLDFKENVLPLLEKYGFKASINIVTGFTDNSISNDFSYLTISDIQNLQENGYEIANHSNSHLSRTNTDDFKTAQSKLITWTGDKLCGAVIPFSQRVDNELHEYFRKNQYLYITDYSHHNVKRSVRLFLIRIFNKIFKSGAGDFLVSSQYYVYKKKNLKDAELPYFSRLPISRKISPNDLIGFIKNIADNSCLTIVFHSIVKNLDEKVDWPEGAWTRDELETLLNYLYKNKNITVMTQKQLVQMAKNEI